MQAVLMTVLLASKGKRSREDDADEDYSADVEDADSNYEGSYFSNSHVVLSV